MKKNLQQLLLIFSFFLYFLNINILIDCEFCFVLYYLFILNFCINNNTICRIKII